MQTDRWLVPINLISFMIDRNECTRSVYTCGIQWMHELIKRQTQRAEIRPEAKNEKWKQRTSFSLSPCLVLTCPRGKGKVVILVIRSSVSHFHSTVVHIDSLLQIFSLVLSFFFSSSNTSSDEKSKYHRAFLWEGAMQSFETPSSNSPATRWRHWSDDR